MKTRRAFIQTGAVALCGLAAAPALAKPRKPKDADWTETFDVIVIGSGLAAFVAGLSALESGAKRVALLEKMGMIRRFHGYQQRDHLRARQPAPKGTRH